MSDNNSQQILQATLLAGKFTPEEVTRLQSIRSHFLQNTQYLDRVLDEQRMKFFKYLIEQGELNEKEL
jgi:hypothetical protein